MAESDWIRQGIMTRSNFVSDEIRAQLVEAEKMRVATYDDKPTHAICRHGVVAEVDAIHHVCGWQMLVRESKANG